MTGGEGLTRIVESTIQTASYRYTLYDDGGSKISGSNATILRDAVTDEWVRDGAVLECKAPFLSFGPSSSGWTVGHARVEVDRGAGYGYLGAFTVGNGSVSVGSGEKLIVGQNDGITIDYSGGSDDPSSMPSDLTELWEMVIDYHETNRPKWLFRLVDSNGFSHDSVSVFGENVEWEKITGGIRYQGDGFSWKTIQSGFTAGSVDVLYFPDPDSNAASLLASVPDSTAFSDDTQVSIDPGDLDVTDS